MADEMKERVQQMPLPQSKEKEFTVTLNLGERGVKMKAETTAQDTTAQDTTVQQQDTQ